MPGRKKKPFINKKTEKYAVFTLKPGQADSALMDHESRIEEQKKYGITFKDEYNYLQHLRERSSWMDEFSDGVTKLSEFGQPDSEETVFVIKSEKKSSSKKDAEKLDSEIKEVLAALDEDIEADHEDEDMSEDFFDTFLEAPSVNTDKKETAKSLIKSTALESDKDELEVRKTDAKSSDEEGDSSCDEEDSDASGADEEDFDTDGIDDEDFDTDDDDEDFDRGDKGNRHWSSKRGRSDSEHSDSSLDAVTCKYKDLKLGDVKLEKLRHLMNTKPLDEEFEDDVSGMDKETFRVMMEQMKDKKDNVMYKDVIEKPVDAERILNRFEYETDSGDEKMVEIVKEVDPYRGFDCESFILSKVSTASTRRFAPRQIEIVPLQKKSNRKKRNTEENTQSEDRALDNDEPTRKEKCAAVQRHKTETAEEKKERKQMVKELQRDRREEKSQKRKIFGQEIHKRKHENVKTAQTHHGTRIEL